jgi:hypothetical protein
VPTAILLSAGLAGVDGLDHAYIVHAVPVWRVGGIDEHIDEQFQCTPCLSVCIEASISQVCGDAGKCE